MTVCNGHNTQYTTYFKSDPKVTQPARYALTCSFNASSGNTFL